MRGQYTVEGQVEEPFDSPERIQRIKDGLWAYLEKDGARDLRWDGPLLRFHGNWRSKLRGVVAGQVSFQPENGRLLVGFCLSFRRRIEVIVSFGLSALTFCVAAITRTSSPLVGILLVIVMSPTLFSESPRLSFRPSAQWYFRMAVTRGLTEVAIQEIEMLRTK